MTLKTRKLILWVPGLVLVAAVVAVTLLILTNNTARINRLEQAQDSPTITFTFNQGVQRFRIICKEDATSEDLYICATIPLPNTPRPSPSPGG